MARTYRHRPYTPLLLTLALAGAMSLAPQIAHALSTPDDAPATTTPAGAISALLADATPPSIDRISLYLRSDDPPGSRKEAAQAITDHPDPPIALVAPLARALELADQSDAAPAVLRALSRYPTTDAIHAVAAYLFDNAPRAPAITSAARAALATQTARPELETDDAVLLAWWERFQSSSERDRRAEIAIAHARRIERLDDELAANNARLLDIYRRLFAQTPDDARSALLAELMRAEQTNIRILGIELATRTLLNAKPLGPRVAAAAAEGLTHRDPSVRAASAVLVDRLNLDEHAEPCAKALAAERDPLAASAMMRYVSRHPRPEVTDAALAWFDEQGPVGESATDLVLALIRDEQLAPEQIDHVRATLDQLAPSQITPQSVALLDQLNQRDRIIPLLDATDARVASAAATALGAYPETLALVLDSALARPELFEPACRALMRHRPDAAGFNDASALPAPNPQLKRDILTEFTGALAPAPLLEVASRTDDLATREQYIRRVASPAYINNPDADPARVRLAELLLQTRIELTDPAGALAVSELLPATDDPKSVRARLIDRVRCLVWLNRLDEAESLTRDNQLPPKPWMAALESARRLPHALRIVARIRAVFPDSLSQDEAARLDFIAEALTDAQDEEPAGPPEDSGR